jgi:hypothetical protein
MGVDEIQEYWDGHYLTVCKGSWQMLGFHISQKEPGISPLTVHLPMTRLPTYFWQGAAGSKSTLEHYFTRPLGAFNTQEGVRTFDNITYDKYFTTFRLSKLDLTKDHLDTYYWESEGGRTHVILQNASNRHLSHIQALQPTQGESFYLWMLLQHRPACSFEDAQTVDGQLCPSFQAAAIKFPELTETKPCMHFMKPSKHFVRPSSSAYSSFIF